MRKLLILFPVFLLLSCEGPAGPQGPPGSTGETGPVGAAVGQGFEVKANFNQSNDYTKIANIPENLEILRSDIVMVYILWEVDPETGEDVWQPLPASIFFDDGTELQYGFDHTVADVKLFLAGDPDLDFSTLGSDLTQEKIFRIAVLPVDYVESNKINLKNFKEVEPAIQGSGNKFKRIH